MKVGMTYLQFQVARVNPSPEIDPAEAVAAEFLIDHSDPRECTRRAVAALANAGWRALVLLNAEHGSGPADLKLGQRLRSLFSQAESSGLAYQIEDFNAV